MNANYYKYCIVPQCKSTTIKTPNKLFVYVPKNKERRNKWLKLARRADAHILSTQSRMYFCEDHFDMPNDMANYIQYYIMGSISQVRMKPGCIPSKFECQEQDMPKILKKQRLMQIASERLNKPKENSTLRASCKDISNISSDIQTVEENMPKILIKPKLEEIDHELLPLKPQSSLAGLHQITSNVMIKEEPDYDIDISLNEPFATNTLSSSPPLVYSLEVNSSLDSNELIFYNRKLTANEIILNTIRKIEKKPQLYIGLPRRCYNLIDTIKDELNIPKQHLMFCLNKIRLNSKFSQFSDDYNTTALALSKIFFKNIPTIANAMRPFIVALGNEMNKRNLPRLLRYKYHNVICVIDCLEIEVQKPSKAVNQALTWSKDKRAHTIKYLISCTPNGLINYISPGFGGKTTDTCLVQSCDFVKTLKSGMCVMANGDFKYVEKYLKKSGITLVRPQSVKPQVKMSNHETKLTNQKANLKIHIETVIRRLQQFCMLKSHACINYRFVKILDDIIVIACALVNMPESLIK